MRSASVFDTLFEGPRMCFGDLLSSDGSNENSTTSETSSTESLRNAERKNSFRNEMEAGAASTIEPISSVTDQNVRRSMAWNWNPQQIKKPSDGRKIANSDSDYLQHLSYDCYDQTLDRLMGEFNVNKVRKRNWNRNTDNNRDGNYNSMIMSDSGASSSDQQQQQQHQRSKPNRNSSSDVEDVNFWTKVFFNNNNNNNDAPTTKKVQPNTAIIFNSIISNLNDHRTKTTGNSSNLDPIDTNAHDLDDARKSNIEIDTFASAKLLTASNNSKMTQNLSSRRNKNVTSTVHRQGESDDFNDDSNATNENSSIAQTTKNFLQTLNDLRLDYNDLSTEEGCSTSRTSRPRSGHAKAKESTNDFERPNSS